MGMRKKFSYLTVWSLHLPVCFRGLFAGLLLLFVYVAAGDEEEGQDGLDITSTTTLQSALFNLGLSQDSAEDGLKRKSIGVGETITINLEAKDALIGNVKKLEWKVEDEKGVLILPDKMKGVKTIDLTANPAAKEAGKVKITDGVEVQALSSRCGRTFGGSRPKDKGRSGYSSRSTEPDAGSGIRFSMDDREGDLFIRLTSISPT